MEKRKVFISVLGTGNYSECTYKRLDFELRTRFVQQAAIEYFQAAEAWDENSDIHILLTKEARNRNWDVCRDFMGNITNEQGLRAVLNNMGLKSAIHDVDIADGNSEEELWSIFNTVFSLFCESEQYEVYFDLTHGFRYLPMLVLVLGNYLKFLRNVEIKGIVYGNYEASERGTKPAPIIDLLPLSILQDWTFAAANFIKNGDAVKLEEICMKKISPLLADPLTRSKEIQCLRGYINSVKTFVTQMKFCRGVDIYSSSACASMQKNIPKESTFIYPLNPILRKINESMSDFSIEPTAINQILAAKWCFERGQYQASVTLLQEGIITFFCDRHGIKLTNHEKREIVNHAFMKRYLQTKGSDEAYMPMSKPEDEDKVCSVVSDNLLSNEEIVLQFRSLSDLRNDFNHSGMNANPMKIDGDRGLRKKIESNIQFALQSFCSKSPKNVQAKKPRIFINLSNHPSDKWSEAQLHAARQYGDIEDMPFPQVDPEADDEEISRIADECTRLILDEAVDNDVSVHVMGEMSLTFAIVKRLQDHGIRCVSSTSERISEDLPDGTRKVGFRFRRFREY